MKETSFNSDISHENGEIQSVESTDISPETIKAIQNIQDHEEIVQDAELDMATPESNDDPLYAEILEEEALKNDLIEEYEQENGEIKTPGGITVPPESIRKIHNIPEHEDVVRDTVYTPDPNDDPLFADIVEKESQKSDLNEEQL